MGQLLRSTLKFPTTTGQKTRALMIKGESPNGDPIYYVTYLTSVDGAPEIVNLSREFPTQELALADLTTRIIQLKALASRN